MLVSSRAFRYGAMNFYLLMCFFSRRGHQESAKYVAILSLIIEFEHCAFLTAGYTKISAEDSVAFYIFIELLWRGHRSMIIKL
ncbi:hypothetical protein C8N25_1116 [Algoriphagus antarcticus]|uniref:Uncharacterized protein n=1 Tax=Algoriphagus antarcticus TaxID=238540 RepID=A0A3E0DVU2_9BACT|nr:hypothetical protein C8N25_1116 [Algoriphagus antarcticus]